MTMLLSEDGTIPTLLPRTPSEPRLLDSFVTFGFEAWFDLSPHSISQTRSTNDGAQREKFDCSAPLRKLRFVSVPSRHTVDLLQ